jgi:hypothetical protein
MTGIRMSKRPEGLPLVEHDSALLSRLTARLATTLTTTLHKAPSVAAALASEVSWTVERDDDGLWLTMTFPDGTFSAVGGEWPDDHDSLLSYVDDVARKLARQDGAARHGGE